MTSELVPWRGHTVPVLSGEISRYNVADLVQMMQQGGYGIQQPIPVQTTYGRQAQEPIPNNFPGFVEGLLYSDGPVAAAQQYRLRVFAQAPLLYQELNDGRPGDFFDDDRLDLLRSPWPAGTLSDLMKRSLINGDLGGNGYGVVIEDELVMLRPDWVKIVLERRMYNGVQVGWRQVGIAYCENGLWSGDMGDPEIATFLPGEYFHFVPGLPDPLATYRGMSWLTPIVREVMADKAATEHKLKYFENAASPNLAVKTPAQMTPDQFRNFVALMREQHDGVANAGKTLYLGDGADVTVVGGDMRQMDFTAVSGKGETRVANAAGVPPVLLSFSEGMQGSSLNAGNYQAAKRSFVDTTMRDLWMNWCGSLQALDVLKPEPKTRIWYDPRDIPFLHEDQKDAADIQSTKVSTINSAITAGFKPEIVVKSVVSDDLKLLETGHTGLTSVQLLPPGAKDTNGDGSVDTTDATQVEDAQAADAYQEALQAARSEVALWQLEDIARVSYDEDDEVDRAKYDVRNPKGSVGGGRFRKISAVIVDALTEWMHGDGTDDPLPHDETGENGFTREQLRQAGIQQGLTFRRGAPVAEIKLALLNKARADSKAGRPASKVTEAAPKPETNALDALTKQYGGHGPTDSVVSAMRENGWDLVDQPFPGGYTFQSPDGAKGITVHLPRGEDGRITFTPRAGKSTYKALREYVNAPPAALVEDSSPAMPEQPSGMPEAPDFSLKFEPSPQRKAVLVDAIASYGPRYRAADGTAGQTARDISDRVNGTYEETAWIANYIRANPAVLAGPALTDAEIKTRRKGAADDLSKRAFAAFAAGRHDEALNLIDQAAALDPDASHGSVSKWDAIRQAVREKASKATAPGPAARASEVDNRIRDAYANASKGDTGFVSLADIRDQLGDIPRAEQDAAFRRLALQPDAEIIPVANSKSIAPRFGADPRYRDAAITIGGEDQHAIRLGGPAVAKAQAAKAVVDPETKFRAGWKKLSPPFGSEAKDQWDDARLGAVGYKGGTPESALRQLDADIAANIEKLRQEDALGIEPHLRRRTVQELPNDIERQRELARLIRKTYGLPPAGRAPAKAAKAKAPKPTPAPEDVAAALKSSATREEAAALLKGKTIADLRRIAAAGNISLPSKATKAQLIADIVHWSVGRRLTSEAIAGRSEDLDDDDLIRADVDDDSQPDEDLSDDEAEDPDSGEDDESEEDNEPDAEQETLDEDET